MSFTYHVCINGPQNISNPTFSNFRRNLSVMLFRKTWIYTIAIAFHCLPIGTRPHPHTINCNLNSTPIFLRAF